MGPGREGGRRPAGVCHPTSPRAEALVILPRPTVDLGLCSETKHFWGRQEFFEEPNKCNDEVLCVPLLKRISKALRAPAVFWARDHRRGECTINDHGGRNPSGARKKRIVRPLTEQRSLAAKGRRPHSGPKRGFAYTIFCRQVAKRLLGGLGWSGRYLAHTKAGGPPGRPASAWRSTSRVPR